MPKEHLLPFDTVQIYYPLWGNKPIHFTYSADALGRLGSRVLTSIRRVFCESVPSQFRKEFVTYDDIMQLRNVNSTHLQDQIKTQSTAITKMEGENVRLVEEIETLTAKLATSEAMLNRNLVDDITQYERAIDASMAETGKAKQQISTIAGALFNAERAKPVLDDLPVWKEIAHLCEAASYSRAATGGILGKVRT